MGKRVKWPIALFVVAMVLVSLASVYAAPVSIKFWYMAWGPNYEAVLKDIIANFEKANPGVNVQAEAVPWTGYVQKFRTAVEGKAAPDISEGSSYQPSFYAAKDEILPVDDIIAQWKKEGRLKDLVSENHKNWYLNGHYYALPTQVDTRMVLYRKDMFEKANVKVPANWDDFEAAAKKLTSGDTYGFVVRYSRTHGPQQFFLSLMLQNNTSIFDKKGRIVLKNPRTVQALKFMKRLWDDKVVPAGATGYQLDDARRVFLQGKAAMIFDTPLLIAQIAKEAPQLMDKVAVAPVMQGPAGKKGMSAWTNPIMIYKQSKHPAEAKAFLKYFTSPENMRKIYNTGEYGYPVWKSMSDVPYYTKSELSKYVVENLLPYGHDYSYPVGGSPIIPAIEEQWILTDMVIETCISNVPPETAIQNAINKIKQIR